MDKRIKNPELAEEFIEGIINRYFYILDRLAYQAVRTIGDKSICKEDILQEIYIYMLKYNFPKVEELSCGDKMWFPFVIGSATNCITNMIKKNNTNKRRRWEVSLDALIENHKFVFNEEYPPSSKLLDLVSVLTNIRNKLDINERRLLSILLNKKNEPPLKTLTTQTLAKKLYTKSSEVIRMMNNINRVLIDQLL